jgi:hypothetical protein
MIISTKNDEAPETDSISISNDMSVLPKSMRKKVNNKVKPKWALTEESAIKEAESKTNDEENDLLNFVDSLNINKYLEDIEVQTMIDKIKLRISELQKEVMVEEKIDEDRRIEKILLKEVILKSSANSN